ncbi:dickkopf-related protein 4 [Eptesicus fuscus]|uniref:dickkopf-related protein 4 n=1 Tax=Eptesicus fuscus TaxID=29078 RepID=UPI00240423D9|nr:dickkopf-related protein 4 [Eptesicus fuscus]
MIWLPPPPALNKTSSYILLESLDLGQQFLFTGLSSQCLSGDDCNTRKLCRKPLDEKPWGATRRELLQRCQRRATCCPGTLCMNDVCATMEDATPVLERQIDDHDDIDTKGTTEQPIQENKPKRKPTIKKSQETHREHVLLAPEIFQHCDYGPELLCRHEVSGNREYAPLRVCQKI